MNPNKVFAMRLVQILNERKISKYKLEKLTGLSHSSLSYILNETNEDVHFSTIIKCCYALNIPLNEFFTSDLFNFENLDF